MVTFLSFQQYIFNIYVRTHAHTPPDRLLDHWFWLHNLWVTRCGGCSIQRSLLKVCPGFTGVLRGASSPSAPAAGISAGAASTGALQPLAAKTWPWALNHPGYLAGRWILPPAQQINTAPSLDELMETPYNWPPEIFWLATAFQAEKRGICESMPWINKVPFISVTLLDLPYRNFCSKAHYCSNKTLSILHVRYWDVNHCTASAGQALTARDEQKSRGSPWAGCGRMEPSPAQRPSEQCLFAGETPRERSQNGCSHGMARPRLALPYRQRKQTCSEIVCPVLKKHQ